MQLSMTLFRSLFVGILSSASILLTPSNITIAQSQQLPPQEISAIAKPMTVRIDGTDEGSGVIIEKSGNTYTVLTNWHVVEISGQYTVQTYDGQKHTVNYQQIQKLPNNVDLALVRFTSDNDYKTAELGESETLGEGQTIHLAGYPGNGQIRGESDRYYRFFNLSINAILPDSKEGGYSVSYAGENFSGMSGSPILDRNGKVIGINGTAYVDVDGKARSNYAIPIDIYTELAPLANSVQSASLPQTIEESNNVAFRNQIVVIDPGSGGQDPGTIGIGGLREKDIVLPISLEVAEILKKQGIEVRMTRDSDYFVSLKERTKVNGDLFVSIHANAINASRPDINGLETYFYQEDNRRLAEFIHWSILNNTNIKNRGIRRARFYVLRNSAMPAVVVEVGFVTGAIDAPRLKNPTYRSQMADAIASGIIQYIKESGI